jgi:hypothetical protein
MKVEVEVKEVTCPRAPRSEVAVPGFELRSYSHSLS